MTEEKEQKAPARRAAKPASPIVYRAKAGLNYGDPERRVEPGELLPDDFPKDAIPSLVACGAIEEGGEE